jgi:lysophospholipase L1-like esterase
LTVRSDGISASSARIESVFRRLGIAVIIITVLLGLTNLGASSIRWVALGLLLHLAPAVMQFHQSFRVVGVWFAVFLVCQALISLALSSNDDFILPPNLKRSIEVADGTVLGIFGTQVFTTDGRGFRVTRTIAYDQKTAKTLRILAIGGSTTEQSLLDDRKTWTHLLQEALQEHFPDRYVEVINAGSSGTRAEHHLATLRATTAIRSDVVLFLMGVNDWNKHIREHFGSNDYSRKQVLLWQARLENTILGGGIRRMFDVGYQTAGRSSVIGMDRMSGQTASINRTDRRTVVLGAVAPDYSRVVRGIIEECHRQRAFCVFLSQPHAYGEGASEELKRRFWMTPPFEKYTLDFESLATIAATYNSFLLGLAREHGLGACDTAARMSTRLDGFYDDCHLNEAGARAFAEGLAECLVKYELVSCPRCNFP